MSACVPTVQCLVYMLGVTKHCLVMLSVTRQCLVMLGVTRQCLVMLGVTRRQHKASKLSKDCQLYCFQELKIPIVARRQCPGQGSHKNKAVQSLVMLGEGQVFPVDISKQINPYNLNIFRYVMRTVNFYYSPALQHLAKGCPLQSISDRYMYHQSLD